MTRLRDMPGSRKRPRRVPRRSLAVVALIILALLGCLVQMSRPQDLSDLEVAADDATAPVRNLTAVFSQAIAGSYPLRLTEAEINRYFAKTLVAEQQGLLANAVHLEKILVRLEQDRAELIMVRRIGSFAFTSSMFLKLEQTESTEGGLVTHIDIDGGAMPGIPFLRQGGRFGRLLLPQGFMIFVRSSYIALADAFPEEIRLGFEEMARVKIEDGIIELDPRFEPDSGLQDF
jgi:hypothetical protein